MNARNIALGVLLAVEKDGAYSALALNKALQNNNVSKLDASFVSALVYGVLEKQITLDYIIKRYSKIPLRKIEIKTKMILRLGVLQLVFMDKIPDSAAVNESVNLAKKNHLMKSAGFINGILRSISRAENRLVLPDENKDKIYYLSVKYSCPTEIVRLWTESYGEDTAVRILASLEGRPQLCARVNTLKTTADELIKELEKDGVEASKSAVDPDALLLKNTGSIESLSAFESGRLYVQDLASQLCVRALDPQPDDAVIDVCSAPGGKSFTCAMLMENSGKINSYDLFEHKLRLIESSAERLGITIIKTAIRDASRDDSVNLTADKVLCDVPCAGLGVINRKPEIRYKDNLISDELCDLQYRILCRSAKLVRSGGTLVYSTCSLNPSENEKNAARFLAEHPDFKPVRLELNVRSFVAEAENCLTLFPFNGTDGFFIAKFQKL